MFRPLTFLAVLLSAVSIAHADNVPGRQLPLGYFHQCADYLKSVKQGEYASYKNKKAFSFAAEFAQSWADGYVSAGEYVIWQLPYEKLTIKPGDSPAKNYLKPYCEQHQDSSVYLATEKYAEEYLYRHRVAVSDKQRDDSAPTTIHLRAGGMRCDDYNRGVGVMGYVTFSSMDVDDLPEKPDVTTSVKANEWFAGFVTGIMELGLGRQAFLDENNTFTGIDYLKTHCKKQPKQRVADIAFQYLKAHARLQAQTDTP